MSITNRQTVKKLHDKLNDGISTFMTTKRHLEIFQNDVDATVTVQLKDAKASLRQKKKDIKNTFATMENLVEAKKEETVEAVTEWKVKREKEKLKKRADQAEAYSEACVTLALYYAAEAELAILEAITARQDAGR